MAFTFKKSSEDKPAKVRAPKAPSSGKLFKFSKSARFVLFLGDEGAILVHLKGNVVESRQFVPDASQPNLDELKETLAKDTGAPVLMVVDSMDQSYVQQTLPPVSAMSVGKLIKRRLDRDFGANDIKGAVLLGREKSGRKDWNFMMISLERSPQLSVWLDFVGGLPNRFEGIRLVSVEVEGMVKVLERSQGVAKEGTGSEWKFFVSHNKVGGFRQVILRNGRVILTRLAQPLADSNPEVIAGSIEQEMLSTIEYMKRLSYNPAAGLDVYIIASSTIRDTIDTGKFSATETKIFTPYEVAQIFGIEGGTQPADQFGDVVLAAIIGGTRKHVLKLSVPQYKKTDAYYNLITYQRVFAAIATLGIIGYLLFIAFDMLQLSSQADDLIKAKQAEQNTLSALRETVARTNLDVERATDLIDLYAVLQEEINNPLPFIEKLKPLIVSPVMGVKAIDWSYIDAKSPEASAITAAIAAIPPADPTAPAAAPVAPNPAAKGNKMSASLVLEFPAIASKPKEYNIILRKVTEDFQAAFKGYEVTFPDKPVEQETANVKVDYSTAKAEAAPANTGPEKFVDSKILIRGDLMVDPPVTPEAKP